MDKHGNLFGLNEVLFIIINLMFFGLFLFWVVNSSSGTFVLEQFYAKQIALLVDSSEPNTVVGLDITDYYEIVEEEKFNLENRFVVGDGKVTVRLTDAQSYSYPCFSDLKSSDVSYSFREVNGDERVFLNINLVKNG